MYRKIDRKIQKKNRKRTMGNLERKGKERDKEIER